MREEAAAIYCRVDRGGDPVSRRETLEQQRQRLLQYAQEQGYLVAGCYEDDGFPGSAMDRPGLQRLLADCREGRFGTVLAVDYNRLFRGVIWEAEWPFAVSTPNPLEHRWKKR